MRFSAGPFRTAQVSDMCGHERVRSLTFREILVAAGMLQDFAPWRSAVSQRLADRAAFHST